MKATHHKHKPLPGCTRTAQADPHLDTTRSRRRAGTRARCSHTKPSSKTSSSTPTTQLTAPRKQIRAFLPRSPPERSEADGDGDAVAGSGGVLDDELVRAGERHWRERGGRRRRRRYG